MGTTTQINRRTSPSEIEGSKLPQNLEAERNLLGAVLLDNEAFKKASGIVGTLDFFLPQNKGIWHRMAEMQAKGVAIDLVTLVEQLEHDRALEACGGAAYISQLTDGMPRVSNVEHYARIVAEKSRLRVIAYEAEAMQREALSPAADFDVLEAKAESIAQLRSKSVSNNPAVVVGFRSLLTMTMPELEYAIEPLLTTGGTGEIYGWRGTGKSLVATEMAVRMASGDGTLFQHKHAGGNWRVARRYRILYIYGEMHGAMIQLRAQQIARGHGLDHAPEDEYFGTMCKDFQKAWRPNIATPQNRKFIEQRIEEGGYEGVIFDNLSTLWPTSAEGEGDRSALLADWFTDLNQRGVWIIYLHHAGKGGTQRGDSSKEDMLDFVVRLTRPHAKKDSPNLCCQFDIEKMRGECKQPGWIAPFEAALETIDDRAVWTIRPAKDAQLVAAFEMFRDGCKPGDVFAELGIARSTAFRYHKKYSENPIAIHWIDQHAE